MVLFAESELVIQHELSQQAQAFRGVVSVLFPRGVIGEILVGKSVQFGVVSSRVVFPLEACLSSNFSLTFGLAKVNSL